MIERLFKLSENTTTVRTEILAGVTTFLTMAYIIFVQPAVLSGKMFGLDTGIDFRCSYDRNMSLGCASHCDHGVLRALSHRSSTGDG